MDEKLMKKGFKRMEMTEKRLKWILITESTKNK
jgi:hypothetical protein